MFSMLVLVLGDNLLVMFVGWEGVGLCSYLLIGFWYRERKKARRGDEGVRGQPDRRLRVHRSGSSCCSGALATSAPRRTAVRGAAAGAAARWPARRAGRSGHGDSRDAGGSTAPRNLASSFRELERIMEDPGRRSGARQNGARHQRCITLVCLLLFVGATGKSAQLPLYVWLPDAMAGPTPVSALIHAATMVTAGVYMVAQTALPRSR